MFEYKKEIVESRTGCLGSSDARMLSQIAKLGSVPKSAYDRMAVVKGYTEKQDDLNTAAVRYGNEIEMAIFNHLTATDKRYQSNPMWVSEKYSRPNVKCIAHPDIVLDDEENKVLTVYEVKTSKKTIEELKVEYRAQIYLQLLLAKEIVEKRSRAWRVRMFLVHYDTTGLDLDEHNEFDPKRLSIHRVLAHSNCFDLVAAMDIVNTFLETFTTQDAKKGEIVDVEYLPTEVQQRFTAMASIFREIKERERKIDEFKEKLYQFLTKRGIAKVKCDDFSFAVVLPTRSIQFDAKAFWEDYANEHPDEVDEILAKYKKEVNKKGYVQIRVAEDKS